MQKHVLIIEQPSVPKETSLRSFLTASADLCCQWTDWDSFEIDTVRRSDARLIVAVTQMRTPRVVSVLELLRTSPIPTPTFAVVPGDADAALVRTAYEASDDFIFTPIRRDELHHRLQRVLSMNSQDLEAVRRRLTDEMGRTLLLGEDPAFLSAIRLLPRFAQSDMAVLITGETGTGKELCARALHHLGRRRNSPFVAVDCGSIPDNLVENELFGHARGAFTDAHRDQKGLVAMAESGTLFLDEIDALSLSAQAKLLRFLQERMYRPLGADRYLRADVNVIAATNRDLESCIRDQRFRRDLYFRLNVLRVHLPPLRERPQDIALLAQHFLMENRSAVASAPRSISSGALRVLSLHDWPGNVRELHNAIQRAIVACDGPLVLASHLFLPGRRSEEVVLAKGPYRSARSAALDAFERMYVEELLSRHSGNVTRAAREAQKDRRAFGRLVKKHHIDRGRF